MKQLIALIKIVLCLMILSPFCYSAKLALVIDDFGYRVHNEKQIILLSPQITVAVLPNSPNASMMANFAHHNGNDVIIHLPMMPISKQSLEVDTLDPSMSDEKIHSIIGQAISKVPYAIGVNNHMGSLMTANLSGMQKVMNNLSYYSLFFLDSKTIANSQAVIAAKENRIATVSRDIFLDDIQDEKAIAHQFDLAVNLARRNGSAVAIGHPYNSTAKVLQEKLAQLPNDIELVKVHSLILKPKKIKLVTLVNQYRIIFEQQLFQYFLLNKSGIKLE